MTDEKIMYPCFSCGREYQFGPHIYDLRVIPSYKISVCKSCFDANWDGWAPHLQDKLLQHLQAQGIQPPPRNQNGLLPRGMG
jgi:hypothetical protein